MTTTVALFGGSFNPPHAAHQLVALYVLETQPVDELWFVPAYAHVFGKPLAPYDHRIAMCELAAAPLGARVRVSRAEQALAARPGFVASRTLELVEHLAAEHPERAFRLVVGSDIARETDRWYRWDELVRRAPPIWIARPGHPVPPHTSRTVEMPDISATAIRAMLAALPPDARAQLAAGGGARAGGARAVGAPGELAQLLPRAVLWYIARHGLFTDAHHPAAPP